MAELDLNDLYRNARNGSAEARELLFDALSARFSLFVRRRVRNREEAEEVVQNALMVISSEYRDLTVTVSFSAWAYKILDNRIKAHWKTRSRSERRMVSISDSYGDESQAASECDPDLKRVLLACLEKIGRANVRYARTLNLKTQGYDSEEICKRLGVTRTNLYSILSRARTLLGRCLQKGGQL